MKLNFYKPNRSGTGIAASFNVGLAKKEEEPALFMNFVRQFSWNNETNQGSFKENAKDPQKTLSIKLNQIEAASLIRAIRNSTEFSTVHTYGDSTTSIKFGPYQKKNGVDAFSMSVSRNGDKFGLGLELGEAELLSQYLQVYLFNFFQNQSE